MPYNIRKSENNTSHVKKVSKLNTNQTTYTVEKSLRIKICEDLTGTTNTQKI